MELQAKFGSFTFEGVDCHNTIAYCALDGDDL